MRRRSFIAGAAAGAAAAAPGLGRARPEREEVPLLDTYLTNVADVCGDAPVGVVAGENLTLRGRPRPYDSRSISALRQDGRPIGYLPTNQSRILASLLAAGVLMQARVTRVRTGPRPGVAISVCVVREAPGPARAR